ncbi:MAG: MASE3 domain-containing protein [Desulfuromonadaceae bacterium]|nr:MASE3 domain-containing protein [Desulfuromonadaceae bacterium]MDD5105244.1 MASE3 domain-containing protein [Desulfuromonadaceae bacterium]
MFDSNRSERLSYITFIVTTTLGLYLSSLHSYLLFHSFIEITTIAIGFTLFILTWNTRRFLAHNFLCILGIGYAFISIIDLFHSLAFKGMNIFPGFLAPQFWIAARYLQAVTLCVAPFFVERKADSRAMYGIYAVLVSLLVAMVFSGTFPECIIPGKGLTTFKIYSEYLITALLLTSLYLFSRKREFFDDTVYFLILSSITFTIVSELSFTVYEKNNDLANMVGHFFKLAAFYLIYRALFVTGLRDPFNIIFKDLKKSEASLKRAYDTMEEKVRERTAELRESEENLHRLNEELEERVAERTSDLEQANTRLMELDRMKSIFIASMSHELRTPLNSVIGYSSILSNEWAGPLNEEQKENLATILRSGKHLLSLLNDVIDVSAIEAGKIEPHHEDFDVFVLLWEAVNSLWYELRKKGLELKVNAIHHMIHSDRKRLLQCLLNLVSNAIKFTEKGTITVCAEIRNDGGTLEISVADTGIGIRGEDLDKLFFPFVRLESPLKTTVLGTGLGLYLTKKLTNEVIRGKISVTSTPNAGSRFVLTIPISGSQIRIMHSDTIKIADNNSADHAMPHIGKATLNV